MQWFKNLDTGLEWLIEDESQIKRMKESDRFEVIDGPKQKKNSELTCEICGKELTSQRGLTAHMRMSHSIGKDGEKIDTSGYQASDKTIEEAEEKKEEKKSTKKKATKKTKKEDGEK